MLSSLLRVLAMAAAALCVTAGTHHAVFADDPDSFEDYDADDDDRAGDALNGTCDLARPYCRADMRICLHDCQDATAACRDTCAGDRQACLALCPAGNAGRACREACNDQQRACRSDCRGHCKATCRNGREDCLADSGPICAEPLACEASCNAQTDACQAATSADFTSCVGGCPTQADEEACRQTCLSHCPAGNAGRNCRSACRTSCDNPEVRLCPDRCDAERRADKAACRAGSAACDAACEAPITACQAPSDACLDDANADFDACATACGPGGDQPGCHAACAESRRDARYACRVSYVACLDATFLDQDGDGETSVDGDCDDHDANVHTGATEVCDGRDDDCDGLIDEDIAARPSALQFGPCAGNTEICVIGAWIDAPGNYQWAWATESCDGIDNNCDGLIDNGVTQPTENQEGRCWGNTELCVVGTWIWNPTNHAPRPELCDGIDDDCDGVIDEAVDGTPDGVACDDHNPCSLGDHCQNALCIGADTVACPATDECHMQPYCNPFTGACQADPVPDGMACDDGDACTQWDSCQAGACVGAEPRDCGPSTDACHAAGVCDPWTGACDFPPVADGTPCDDGDLCSGPDACVQGTCGSSPIVCPSSDSNPCTRDACDPSSGACIVQSSAAGTACDDGDACNVGEACDGAGTCVGGSAVVCTPLHDCDVAACDPTHGGTCAHSAAPDGTSCDDGSVCTLNDSCTTGACGGTTVDCDDHDVCTVDTCDATLGCQHAPAVDGLACDDGNACTVGDSCQAGACAAGPEPRSCDDHNGCTNDGCEPANGCVHADNSDACDDGDACTTHDTCANGACHSGSPVTCSDDACNTSACDHQSGQCVATPRANGTTCSDGNACTTSDACEAGTCRGSAVTCSGDACNTAACSPVSGQCVLTPKANGTTCVDDDLCSATSACQAGHCAATSPVVCVDPGQCQSASCDPLTGACVTSNDLDGSACLMPMPHASTTCSAGTCTLAACDLGFTDCDGAATSGCEAFTLGDTNNCGGCGNVCTLANADAACLGGGCTVAACHVGFSDCDHDPQNGCEAALYTFDNCGGCGVSCDDHDPCTDDACGPTGCVHTPIVCHPTNACQLEGGVCQPLVGCVNPPAENGTACDDGDACTPSDVCASGACVGLGSTCDEPSAAPVVPDAPLPATYEVAVGTSATGVDGVVVDVEASVTVAAGTRITLDGEPVDEPLQVTFNVNFNPDPSTLPEVLADIDSGPVLAIQLEPAGATFDPPLSLHVTLSGADTVVPAVYAGQLCDDTLTDCVALDVTSTLSEGEDHSETLEATVAIPHFSWFFGLIGDGCDQACGSNLLPLCHGRADCKAHPSGTYCHPGHFAFGGICLTEDPDFGPCPAGEHWDLVELDCLESCVNGDGPSSALPYHNGRDDELSCSGYVLSSYGCGEAGDRACASDPPCPTWAPHSTATGRCTMNERALEKPSVSETAPSGGTDLTFVVATDLHVGAKGNNIVDINHAVAMMNGIGTSGANLLWPQGYSSTSRGKAVAKPVAVVTTGDLLMGNFAYNLGLFQEHFESEQGFSAATSLKLPLYLGLGNHDLESPATDANRTDMLAYMKRRMKPVAGSYDEASGSYSWNWQGVHFIQLHDMVFGGSAAKRPSGEAWLINDLQANPTKPTLIFQHYGFDRFSTGADNPKEIWWTPAQRDRFRDILFAAGNPPIKGIFVGHSHAAARSSFYGIPVFQGSHIGMDPESGIVRSRGVLVVHMTANDLDVGHIVWDGRDGTEWKWDGQFFGCPEGWTKFQKGGTAEAPVYECCQGTVTGQTCGGDACALSYEGGGNPTILCGARCPAGTTLADRGHGGVCCQGTVGGDGKCYLGNGAASASTCTLDGFLSDRTGMLWCPQRECPTGSALYGLTPTGKGFCCSDTVSDDFMSCSGSSTRNMCSLSGDPAYRQGYPYCPTNICPAGSATYGLGAGGFCCDGDVRGDHWGCNTHSVCALNGVFQTQGYPYCRSVDCPPNLEPYGLDDGGFCCNGSADPTNQMCWGSSACALDPSYPAGLGMCAGPACPAGWTGYGGGLCCSGGVTSTGACSTNNACAADIDVAKVVRLPVCGGPLKGRIALRSMATIGFDPAGYLTAASYGNSPLTPFAATIGSWELFDVIWNENGSIALRSTINNKYVSTHGSYGSRLAADQTSVTFSESFFVEENGDGTISLMALGVGQYVAVEPAYTNNLVADEGVKSPKTRFKVYPQ